MLGLAARSAFWIVVLSIVGAGPARCSHPFRRVVSRLLMYSRFKDHAVARDFPLCSNCGSPSAVERMFPHTCSCIGPLNLRRAGGGGGLVLLMKDCI